MSGRFGNPLLAEAIRLAKAKELAKKKEGEEEGEISKNGGEKQPCLKKVKSGTSRWEVSQEKDGTAKSKKQYSPIRWDNNLKDDFKEHENGARGSFQTKMAERAHAEIQAFRQRMAEVKAAGVDEKAPRKMVGNSNADSEDARAQVLGNLTEERDLGADLEELESDEPSGSMQIEEEAEMGPEGPLLTTLQEREGVEAYPEMSQSSTSMETEGSESDAKEDNDIQYREEASVPFKRRISMLNECRSVEKYEKLNRISEGTYGVVYRYVGKYGWLKHIYAREQGHVYVCDHIFFSQGEGY